MCALALLLAFIGFMLPAFAATRATVDEVEQSAATPSVRPGAARQVTVAQLAGIIADTKSKSDAAREIEHLQLTERLSSPKLAILEAELRSAKARTVLMGVADASVFLAPPADEIPEKPVPSMSQQRQIMLQAVHYLNTALPRLPDFYARRFTTAFEEMWMPTGEKGMPRSGSLHTAGEFRATVYYRGGKEVVNEKGAREQGLITVGTFGPILSVVILDAAHSATTQWSRWEEGPNGPLAVFQFRVPQAKSHYSTSGSGELGTVGPTAYHGEIGVDPDSGTILRLVLEADPGLGSPTERADIMVEYGSVAIGGKMYTCPVRSVSYSVGGYYAPTAFGTSVTRKAVRLNDVVFSNYHVFRTEMRIMP
jgi:hypothetical protein